MEFPDDFINFCRVTEELGSTSWVSVDNHWAGEFTEHLGESPKKSQDLTGNDISLT